MTGAGCDRIRLATLAVSIAEPPPTDTKPSTSCSSAKSAACCSDSSVGSTRDASYTMTSMPSSRICWAIRSGWPSAATPGSVTSMTRRGPRRLSSHPASLEAPGPNLTGVASRVNTDSRLLDMPIPFHFSGQDDVGELPRGEAVDVADDADAEQRAGLGDRVVVAGAEDHAQVLVDGQRGDRHGDVDVVVGGHRRQRAGAADADAAQQRALA